MSESGSNNVGKLITLALPIMGSQLSGVLMFIVDGVMCGHIPDHGLSLTALGFAVQIWFLFAVAARALMVGTVAVASRARGAGDIERVNRTAEQSATITVIAGTVAALVVTLVAVPMFRALGASPGVAEAAARYLRMVAIGFPALFLADGCLESILRSVGNTRLPLFCGLIGNTLNVVLGYGLIFGHFGLPAMGLVGAGLATAIARYAILALMYVAIRTNDVGGVIVRLRFAAIDRGITRQVLHVALPFLFERLMFFGAMTALIWMLAHIDEPAVAAHSIGARASALLLVPAFGIEMAMGALVGTALGGNSVANARAMFRAASYATIAIMVPIGIATYVGASWIVAIYDVPRDSAAWGYTVSWLHIVAIAIVLQGLMVQLQGVLLGAGASRTVMKINVSTDLGLRLVLAVVLGFGTDLKAIGVWLSWPLTLLVQLPLTYIAYRRGRWAVTGMSVDK